MPKNRQSHKVAYAAAETTPDTPVENVDFATREKQERNNSFAWAQRVIQTQYEKHGLSDEFLWEPLRWYLVFQAAYRLPTFHQFSRTLLRSCGALLDKLPANQQDKVNQFHLQLAADPTRSLKHKWEDRGIPIYRFLNRAFKYEWAKLKADEIKNSISHVPISIVPDNEDDDLMSMQSRIDAEISLGDYVQAPEPWFGDDDPGAERERKEKALVWNADLKALVRPDAVRLHPGYKIGKPLWEAIRAFKDESEVNSIIVDTIAELDRVDYSKISRRLIAAGFNVNHDRVRRIVMKFEGMLVAVRNSAENQRSKHNTYANILPQMPTITIPPKEVKR